MKGKSYGKSGLRAGGCKEPKSGARKTTPASGKSGPSGAMNALAKKPNGAIK